MGILQQAVLKKKVAEIIEDRSKSELLFDLLPVLDDSSAGPKAKLYGLHAIVKAMIHVIKRGDMNDPATETKTYAESNLSNGWLSEVFDQTWSKLLTLISHDDIRLSQYALSSAFHFLVAKHEACISQQGK